MRVGGELDDAAIGAANARMNIKAKSFRQAVYTYLSWQWLGLGDKVRTDEASAVLKDNCINVGLVAALLFAVITQSWQTSSNVGDKLTILTNGRITMELTEQVFLCLSSISMWCLFGSVMHSLYMYCQIAELNGPTEVAHWADGMGPLLLNIHFMYLMYGLITFIASQCWLALTVMRIEVALVSLGFLALFVAPPLAYASVRSVHGLYLAKAKVADAYRTGGAGSFLSQLFSTDTPTSPGQITASASAHVPRVGRVAC